MGVTSVGTIEYDARIQTKNLRSDSKEVEGIARQTGQSLGTEVEKGESKASAALSKLTGVMKATGIAIGVAGAAAVTFGITSAASFQQTRIGLENMLGSADKAKKLLADISKFAAETPFEFPELAQAAKQLVAFGFSAEDAFNTMKQLGDVSAAVGAPINDLAYLMGTLRTQGRAFTIDIRQFAQRGVPIYEYLAKVLKVDEKALTGLIEAGKVGFPEVQKAFQLMTAEGGKFHGTMEAQSKSLTGLMSTLKDNLGQVARSIVGIDQAGDITAGSILDRIGKGMTGAIDAISRNAENAQKIITNVVNALVDFAGKAVDVGKQVGSYLAPKIEALINTFKSLAPTLGAIFHDSVMPLATALGKTLVVAIGLAISTVNALVNALRPMLNWMASNKAGVIGLATAFGTLYTALKISAGIQALSAALTTLRMGFVATTIATVGLRAAVGALLISIGPLGWAIAAVSAVAGVLTTMHIRNKAAADQNKVANDELRLSADNLKLAQDRLAGANLSVEGAQLRVEAATKHAKDMLDQYGGTSYEARQAAFELKQAQYDLRDATKQAADAADNARAAESRYAKNGDLMQATQIKINQLAGLQTALNNAIGAANTPISNPNLNKKPSIGVVPHNATGTDNWGGGPTWVGEKGPEIIDLPRGSRVIPNNETGSYGSGPSNRTNIGQINISNELDGTFWLRKITRDDKALQNNFTPQRRLA